jgi:hypothetical protein
MTGERGEININRTKSHGAEKYQDGPPYRRPRHNANVQGVDEERSQVVEMLRAPRETEVLDDWRIR